MLDRPKNLTLDDILLTEELSRRSPSPPNWQAEVRAMQTLAAQMARNSETLLQSLVDVALELCQAGTAGVSLLETPPEGEEVFCWNVLAGQLAEFVGGTVPRNFSPCGVCLDRGAPQLYSHPERYFTYLQAKTPIVEGLVLPLIAENEALGTIWIVSHDEGRHFNPEDVRVMAGLADFTAIALQNQRRTQELQAANARLEVKVAERRQAELTLRDREALLEEELANTKLLQQIGSQLITEDRIDVLYEQIIEAAIALMGSDMASLQMLVPEETNSGCWRGGDFTRNRRNFGNRCR